MVGWESADRLEEVEAGGEGRKLRLREAIQFSIQGKVDSEEYVCEVENRNQYLLFLLAPLYRAVL